MVRTLWKLVKYIINIEVHLLVIYIVAYNRIFGPLKIKPICKWSHLSRLLKRTVQNVPNFEVTNDCCATKLSQFS